MSAKTTWSQQLTVAAHTASVVIDSSGLPFVGDVDEFTAFVDLWDDTRMVETLSDGAVRVQFIDDIAGPYTVTFRPNTI